MSNERHSSHLICRNSSEITLLLKRKSQDAMMETWNFLSFFSCCRDKKQSILSNQTVSSMKHYPLYSSCQSCLSWTLALMMFEQYSSSTVACNTHYHFAILFVYWSMALHYCSPLSLVEHQHVMCSHGSHAKRANCWIWRMMLVMDTREA